MDLVLAPHDGRGWSVFIYTLDFYLGADVLVKVQMPKNVADPASMALIYNEDRSFKSFCELTPRILELMNGRRHAFFEIKVDRHGGITFKSEAPWQDW